MKLSHIERAFIKKVEQNRGEIKNKDKYYPMPVGILNLGIKRFHDELQLSKHLGIGFVWEVCTRLSLKDQMLLADEIYNGDKITATGAKLKATKYL